LAQGLRIVDTNAALTTDVTVLEHDHRHSFATVLDMTNAAIRSTLVALVLLAGTADAQNTPLFAGTWRPHDLSIVLSISDESQDITIRQDAETIAITEPGNPRTTSVYKLDGSESRNRDTTSRVSWDGGKLVIEAVNSDLKRTRVVLTLNPAGPFLIVSRDDYSGVPEPTIYRKRN